MLSLLEVFSCVFLFAVFISLFIAFIADDGYYKPTYPLSIYNMYDDSYSYVSFQISNNEGAQTVTFRLTYNMENVFENKERMKTSGIYR